jgi:periplasmic protein TonB
MSAPRLPWLEDESPHDLVRWIVAAAIVVSLHGAVVAFAFSWREPTEIGGDSDVVTIELAPIDSTPDAVATNVAPAPETTVESNAVPQPQEEQPKEQPKIEQPRDDTPGTVTLPDAKPVEKNEAALPPAPRTAERVKGGAPRIEPSWQTSLMQALQRAKRYPPRAQAGNEQGVVVLNFSLDRNGHVLARRIVKSSGFAALDDEVMGMVMRAEPLPAFPPTMPETQLNLTVPIRFSLY